MITAVAIAAGVLVVLTIAIKRLRDFMRRAELELAASEIQRDQLQRIVDRLSAKPTTAQGVIRHMVGESARLTGGDPGAMLGALTGSAVSLLSTMDQVRGVDTRENYLQAVSESLASARANTASAAAQADASDDAGPTVH